MKCLGKYAYKHIGEIIGVNTYIDERPPQGAALASSKIGTHIFFFPVKAEISYFRNVINGGPGIAILV